MQGAYGRVAQRLELGRWTGQLVQPLDAPGQILNLGGAHGCLAVRRDLPQNRRGQIGEHEQRRGGIMIEQPWQGCRQQRITGRQTVESRLCLRSFHGRGDRRMWLHPGTGWFQDGGAAREDGPPDPVPAQRLTTRRAPPAAGARDTRPPTRSLRRRPPPAMGRWWPRASLFQVVLGSGTRASALPVSFIANVIEPRRLHRCHASQRRMRPLTNGVSRVRL
jgi:hypothetical protein